MTTKIITVEATPPAESTGADYYKGAPLNAAEFDQNLVNLRAAVDRKASLSNPTFTGTVVLPATTSIGDVSATELQYLNSVTSNVQDQINAKAPINNPTFTGTVSLSTGTANGVLYLNGSKQVTSGSGLVFDSSGNLGIGVTPSAWGASWKAFQSGNAGSIASHTAVAAVRFSSNERDYDVARYLNSTFATRYEQYEGQHKWYTAPSGTAGNAISFTQAMTLDASGNLMVGTTSNSASYGRTLSLANGGSVGISFNDQSIPRQFAIGTRFGNLVFDDSTAGAERMRIDSSGRLLVGTSSSIEVSYRFQVANGNGGGYFECVASGDSAVLAKNTSGGGYIYAGVNSSGTLTYYVLPTGDVKNTNNSYGAISDQKLKENIIDASPKLDDLCKVKVRSFNFIGDELKQIGVIAQELEEIFPGMVDETPDYDEVTKTRTIDIPAVLDEEGNEVEPATTKEEEYTERVATGTTTKSVKYSVFVPMLIKAVQEQQAIIESLTQRIEALEYTKQGE